MPHAHGIDTESHSALHAFCVRPKVSFETQTQDEEVLLVLRAHPITQLSWILNTFFLLILLVVLQIFLYPAAQLSAGQTLFANILGIFFTASYAWFNFVSWFFNVGIVTNERIVDIDFHAVIYKEISATGLEKVEDVTAKSGGYFASLFNFGDVFIQTAGTHLNIEFLKIPHPTEVARIINQLIEPE